MFKRLFITTFIGLLIGVFCYGYITVYTNSYNTINENHIIDFDFEYSQQNNSIYITLLGKDYTIDI